MQTQHDFETWLSNELNDRGWSIRELARRAHVSAGAISNAMSGMRNPGPTLCRKISFALGITEEEVLRKAGLLSSAPKSTERTEKLLTYFSKLSAEMQNKVITMVKSITDS